MGRSTPFEVLPGARLTGAVDEPAPSAGAVKPGLLAPKPEKAMFRAVQRRDWPAVERLGAEHDELAALATTLVGLGTDDDDRAVELLRQALDGPDVARDPFAEKYLRMDVTFEVVPGVEVEVPVGRHAVGLALAELLRRRGDRDGAVALLRELGPTTVALLALVGLHQEAGDHAAVVELTADVTNEDDLSALLCTFRGVALREQRRHEAARAAFREALRSKRRDPAVRHRALLERAATALAEGKVELARQDLDRVTAEDPDHPGARRLEARLP
jgi:tetratricopeptide (TPR) repeat protein